MNDTIHNSHTSNVSGLLHSLAHNGIISTEDVQKQMEDILDRQYYLQMHDHKIWQGKNGLYYTYIKDSENRRVLKKRNSLIEMEDFLIDYYKNHLSVNDLFYEWASQKLKTKNIQEQTYNRYELDFKRFIKNTDFGKMEVCNVTEEILEDFVINAILEYDLTAKSFSQLRTILNGMFKYAKKKKFTRISISAFFQDLDLSKNMFRKNQKNDEDEVFTDFEVKQITNYVKDNITIWNLAVLLAFQTGLRVGELTALKPEDINWKECTISVNKTEIKIKDKVTGKFTLEVADHAKTAKGEREVIFPDHVIWTLKEIMNINPNGTYLFENENGKRIRGTTINRKLYTICKNLGIPVRSIHKARKTYGTELFNAGTDECIIKDQLGHTDILTSLKYYRKSNHTIQDRKKQIANAIIAI